MLIGIDGSRAFLKQRTGIEEYSYQVIKHLRDKLVGHQVILYVRKNTPLRPPLTKGRGQGEGFDLPKNWKIKKLRLPYFSSQIRFSLEFLLNPVDVLFVPSHVIPPIHSKNTIVTIHGLEYEFVPGAYSWWARLYMRTVIKNSCHWAKKIIAVSRNTRQDIVNLYKISEDKIEVIYEGISDCHSEQSASGVEESNQDKIGSLDFARDDNNKYLLFIGRLEERKNIIGIIKAFEILKEHYKIPHKLVLAGKFGYGEEEIRRELQNVNCTNDIIIPGYVSEEGKWELLKNADVFMFPTFYEGFGLPILEAQSVGVPVVAGNNSSIPEIVRLCHSERSVSEGEESNKNKIRSLNCARDDNFSALLVDSRNSEEIADAAYKLISDQGFRSGIIEKGYDNVKRFSWDKCAKEIAELLKNNG